MATNFNTEEFEAYVKAQVAAALATELAARPSAPVRIKPVKPDAFYGKANENVRQWIFAVELWFTAGHVTSDPDRIIFAVSLLRDTALVWWRSIHELPDVPTTWSEYKAAIIVAFEPVNPAESARDRLATLRQTGSVRTYASFFRSIAMSIPNITDDEKKDRFIRGLKSKTMQEVKLRCPESFDEAVRMSVRFDSLMWRSPSGNPGKNGHTNPRPEPMDLGAISAFPNGQPTAVRSAVNAVNARPSYRDVTTGNSNPRRSKLTEEERAKLRREGKCFKCRQHGHLARECPERSRSPN